jgi:hypothetical protein
MITKFQAAADAMRKRMEVFQLLAIKASERRDKIILAPSELWEPEDQAAIDAFDSAKAELVAGTPLPMDTVPNTVPIFCNPAFEDHAIQPWCPGECGQ